MTTPTPDQLIALRRFRIWVDGRVKIECKDCLHASDPTVDLAVLVVMALGHNCAAQSDANLRGAATDGSPR
jgi:hypothetical protein